jgi:hypothetical protein
LRQNVAEAFPDAQRVEVSLNSAHVVEVDVRWGEGGCKYVLTEIFTTFLLECARENNDRVLGAMSAFLCHRIREAHRATLATAEHEPK